MHILQLINGDTRHDDHSDDEEDQELQREREHMQTFFDLHLLVHHHTLELSNCVMLTSLGGIINFSAGVRKVLGPQNPPATFHPQEQVALLVTLRPRRWKSLDNYTIDYLELNHRVTTLGLIKFVHGFQERGFIQQMSLTSHTFKYADREAVGYLTVLTARLNTSKQIIQAPMLSTKRGFGQPQSGLPLPSQTVALTILNRDPASGFTPPLPLQITQIYPVILVHLRWPSCACLTCPPRSLTPLLGQCCIRLQQYDKHVMPSVKATYSPRQFFNGVRLLSGLLYCEEKNSWNLYDVASRQNTLLWLQSRLVPTCFSQHGLYKQSISPN